MSEKLNTGTDELLCDIDQRVATITLNRPEKRNALSDNHTRTSPNAARAGNPQRCGLHCHYRRGAAFCAGGDVGGMSSNNAQGQHATR